MKSLSRRGGRVAAAGALCAAALLLAPFSAQAEAKTVPYLCPKEYKGQVEVLHYERVYDVTAPASVHPGQRFQVTVDNAPINPLTKFNRSVDVRIVYTLPAGAKVVDKKLVGGSNLGRSKQKVSVQGDRLVLTASGPFSAGEDHDLPNVVLTLVAPRSGPLTITPAGTSSKDPGFRWTAENVDPAAVPDLVCYPDPATPVVLSRTEVKR